MTVEKGAGVTYIWFDIPENALENIEPWTDVAKKIRAIQDDIYRQAIAFAPVGRERLDNQPKRIKSSHYKGAGIGKSGPKQYRQVVGNSARHAEWVHEGTLDRGRFEVYAGERWHGPVFQGTGPGEVNLSPPRPWKHRELRHGDTASWATYHGYVYFEHYLWNGQAANDWLARAGQAAYRMPGNH